MAGAGGAATGSGSGKDAAKGVGSDSTGVAVSICSSAAPDETSIVVEAVSSTIGTNSIFSCTAGGASDMDSAGADPFVGTTSSTGFGAAASK